jgi:hypothetical protein
MKNGGWTLVGNYFDAAGDDMPNTTDYVVSGWQQTGSGKWDAKAATVDRAWGGGTGSSAVSLAFVEALGKAAGQKNLKMCFVHQNGYDTTCRQSSDGSLTLVSYPMGNPKLTVYANDKLTYTFGRLGGLAGSADGYDPNTYTKPDDGTKLGYCVPVTSATSKYEFGDGCGGYGLCEVYQKNNNDAWQGVWHGYCFGSSYRPWFVNEDELGGDVVNPSVSAYGFRLYIGP